MVLVLDLQNPVLLYPDIHTAILSPPFPLSSCSMVSPGDLTCTHSSQHHLQPEQGLAQLPVQLESP